MAALAALAAWAVFDGFGQLYRVFDRVYRDFWRFFEVFIFLWVYLVFAVFGGLWRFLQGWLILRFGWAFCGLTVLDCLSLPFTVFCMLHDFHIVCVTCVFHNFSAITNV